MEAAKIKVRKYPYDLNLIIDGDSLSDSSTEWPYYLIQKIIKENYIYSKSNYAKSGQSSVNALSDCEGNIAKNYSLRYKNNIVILWIGTNDYSGGTNGDVDALRQNITDYYDIIKSYGHKMVGVDINNRIGGAMNWANEVHDMWVDNWRKMSDIYVRLIDDHRLLDPTDTDIYLDTVHMTPLGNSIVADNIWPKFKALIQ